MNTTGLTIAERFSLIQPGDVVRVSGVKQNWTADWKQPEDKGMRCVSGPRGSAHLLQLDSEGGSLAAQELG